MCGIIGAIAQNDISEKVLNSLDHLAYRGYDSCGIAFIRDNKLLAIKALGKISNLKKLEKNESFKSNLILGHTRWATHGSPSIENAHPMISGDLIAVVHNGIIENYQELKNNLQSVGYVFSSDTDTEVIAHFIFDEYKKSGEMLQALQKARNKFHGRYSFALINKNYPNTLFGLCHGSPLVVGIGNDCKFLSSDSHAISETVDSVMYCEEGDIIKITLLNNYISDKFGNRVDRKFIVPLGASSEYLKGKYRYYMEKEIHEQPKIIEHLISYFYKGSEIDPIFDPEIPNEIIDSVEHIQLVACGSSYNAACIACYWFESILKVTATVEIASEYLYRDIIVHKNTMMIILSQSGETADTVASAQKANKLNYLTVVGLVNELHSTLVRLCRHVCPMQAGIEMAVASTKTFTAQLFSLISISIHFSKVQRKFVDHQLIEDLKDLPEKINKVIKLDEYIKKIAWDLRDNDQMILMGRNVSFPLINEASLKLKEISYIHAHSYALGELKHGTMALIKDDLVCIISLINNVSLSKSISNIHEIHARKGKLIIFSDESCPSIAISDIIRIDIPSKNPTLSPILHAVAFQLLAYHLAIFRGNDVDCPRNLAKCVSVE